MTDTPKRPDLIQNPDEEADDEQTGGVLQPTKLIRIASMTRALLDEVRQAPLDEQGRARLQKVHDRTIGEMREVLTDDLLDEFDEMFDPLMSDGVPTEAELRVAQAQLIGWLEGLFHGIQASLFSQQMAAQAQLAEMQKRQQLGRPQQQPDQRSGLYI